LAIVEQNALVQERESTDKLVALELRLVWPPVTDINTKGYVPDNCRAILMEQPAIALRNNRKVC
jgi:hypothetical protein